ncbi:helix-turn-helix domain-containing protein [Mycolicibacterium arabiense]|nr:helix-turn-helix domain-containing protein [Mycolicibacterium arabiense]MCV7371975.1 helix-turn-helix domain-containing protein [Mycolicibacterium arabiense]
MTVEMPARWEVTDDVGVFTDMLRNCYLPFATTGLSGGLEVFSATVREQPLGQLRLIDGHMAPHGGVRRRRQVSSTSRDVVGLQYVLAGREVVYRDGDLLSLGPGEFMVWDTDVTGGYEIVEAVRKRTLILPRGLADALLPRFHDPATIRVIRGSQAASLHTLFDVLAVLSDKLSSMTPQATERAAQLVIQMLADLGGGAGQRAGGRRGATALCEKVLAYVEDNLADPALKPATVAAAHYVSIRTLYDALQPIEVPLATHIRARRLARCYTDLVTTDDPVGDIAARWGFTSMAHFSRAFSKQYGVAPSRSRGAA